MSRDEDCYYFLYSSCQYKDKCLNRHNEKCKSSLITCKNWKSDQPCRPDCMFRHSEFHIKKNRDDEMCYWETKPSGCTKVRCEFKHVDKSKDEWKEVKVRSLDEIQKLKAQEKEKLSKIITNDLSGNIDDKSTDNKSQISYESVEKNITVTKDTNESNEHIDRKVEDVDNNKILIEISKDSENVEKMKEETNDKIKKINEQQDNYNNDNKRVKMEESNDVSDLDELDKELDDLLNN